VPFDGKIERPLMTMHGTAISTSRSFSSRR
jgi:hypothetical protein